MTKKDKKRHEVFGAPTLAGQEYHCVLEKRAFPQKKTTPLFAKLTWNIWYLRGEGSVCWIYKRVAENICKVRKKMHKHTCELKHQNTQWWPMPVILP